MSKTQAYITGAEIDFAKGSKAGKYGAELGRCRIVSIRHNRVWTEVQLEILAGKRAGQVTTFKVRDSAAGSALEHLADLAPIAAQATKDKRDAAYAASSRKYEAESKKYERTSSLNIEPGDIVKVKDTRNGNTVRFRVYEVDYTKNRIKGWEDGRRYTQIGNRMGYYSTAHDNVFEFEIVEKKAFDLELDPLWNAYKANTAEAGEKRASTRARRNELKDIFGW
jgi:hypothetical protein